MKNFFQYIFKKNTEEDKLLIKLFIVFITVFTMNSCNSQKTDFEVVRFKRPAGDQDINLHDIYADAYKKYMPADFKCKQFIPTKDSTLIGIWARGGDDACLIYSDNYRFYTINFIRYNQEEKKFEYDYRNELFLYAVDKTLSYSDYCNQNNGRLDCDHIKLQVETNNLIKYFAKNGEIEYMIILPPIDSITQPYYELQEFIEQHIAKYQAVDTNTIGRWGDMRLYIEDEQYFVQFISSSGFENVPVSLKTQKDNSVKVTFEAGLIASLGYGVISTDSSTFTLYNKAYPEHPTVDYRVESYDYSFWGDKYIFGFKEYPLIEQSEIED